MTDNLTNMHQEAAEAEIKWFHDQLGPFVVAAEKTRMAMVFTNAKLAANPVIFANDAFLRLTGYSRAEVLGDSFNSLMAKGIGSSDAKLINAAFGEVSDSEPEICFRRSDETSFWASIFISAVCDGEGKVVQHFVSLVDETDRHNKQAHCEMLIDELNHRVKNTLATVQSIARQALRHDTNSATAREAIESRIFALSRSHDLLSRQNWEGTSLRELIKSALQPFGVANGGPDRFTISGCDFRLSPKVTLALGIALHELATNAVKYGAFCDDAGTVRISWVVNRADVESRLILSWQEIDGPTVEPHTHKGFGTQVLERGLAHELAANVTLDYRPAGLVATIDLPAPEGPING